MVYLNEVNQTDVYCIDQVYYRFRPSVDRRKIFLKKFKFRGVISFSLLFV